MNATRVNATALALPPQAGFCEGADYDADCNSALKGSWPMPARATFRTCIRRCLTCSRCNYVSFSAAANDCTWTFWCDMARLNRAEVGLPPILRTFRTLQVRDAPPVSERPLPPPPEPPYVSPFPGVEAGAEAGAGAGRGGRRFSNLLHLPPESEHPVTDPAIRSFAHRLSRGGGKRLTIAVYGTSVTAGAGSTRDAEQHSYTHALERRLRRRYPATPVRVLRRAFPGATAAFMRHCVDSLAPERADMYIVELMDNMDGHGLDAVEAHLRAILRRFESRHCGGRPLALPRAPSAAASASVRPALLVLSPLTQRCVRRLTHRRPYHTIRPYPYDARTAREGAEECLRSDSPSTQMATMMERVASSLGVGVVSVRRALRAPLLAAARGSYGGVSNLTRFLIEDYSHPTREGHALIAELIEREISSALLPISADDEAAALRTSRQTDLCGSGGGGSEGGGGSSAGVCAFGERLHPLVLRSRGWSYVVEHSRRRQPKPGYVAREPGATLDVCFRPPPSAGGPRSPVGTGESAPWRFAHLTSYTQMGKASAECVDGCTCTPAVFNGHLPGLVSQPAIAELWARPWSALRQRRAAARAARGQGAGSASSCPCVIRLTTLNETESGGHKFKLIAVFAGFELGGYAETALQHSESQSQMADAN